MKLFHAAVLILSALLYILNQYFLPYTGSPFLHGYFSDLLAMPAMLSYINLILSVFRKPLLTSWAGMLLVTLGCGFLWEVAALYIKPGSVCDVFDLVCYILGSLNYKILLHFFKGDIYHVDYLKRKSGSQVKTQCP